MASSTLLLDVPQDDDGNEIGPREIINPNAPLNEQRYKTKVVDEDDGNALPTIGLVIQI